MDVNASFGYDPRKGVLTTPEQVKLAGQRWGVAQACVASITAVLFDCEAGNRETLDLCARDGFFQPVAVISPIAAGALEKVARAREAGFAMARLHPEVHGYAVDSEACTRVLAACNQAGLPVMLPSFACGTASIVRALERHTAPVILTNNRYACLGEVVALADRLPSAYVELSEVNTPDGIEVLAQTYSFERLLWGSGYPAFAVGASVMRLTGSGLRREQLALIGSANARRLLGDGP
jgi:predicted TIM-barrel fold metal-dependent hydrolase